jgi:hypothetical protein
MPQFDDSKNRASMEQWGRLSVWGRYPTVWGLTHTRL